MPALLQKLVVTTKQFCEYVGIAESTLFRAYHRKPNKTTIQVIAFKYKLGYGFDDEKKQYFFTTEENEDSIQVASFTDLGVYEPTELYINPDLPQGLNDLINDQRLMDTYHLSIEEIERAYKKITLYSKETKWVDLKKDECLNVIKIYRELMGVLKKHKD